ncbi:MAG TPA: sialidase family protein, partial [Phycisphaerae bacterium]|nr:sialidase family protein [Phycisphaerae bacterium]
MTRLRYTIDCIGTSIMAACMAFGTADPRNIRNGSVIPDEGYCDQPYMVITKDGNWLCTFTTGKGIEGQLGQHVVASISTDKGKTWSDPPIDIEPADGPEASWVMPLVTPSGRVYAFYAYNGDRIDTLGDKRGIRADMLGWYVYKYSDDNGRTWSDKRYRLPVRVTACDRTNDWQGKVQIMWGIGKPVVVGPSVFFGFTKLGRYMLDEGEGWFFRSDNILTEPDVEKIEWQMLPEGEHGIRAPEFGSVQEEHNLVGLSDGSLYCIYRTTTGYPCHVYSRDGGKTWTRPEHAVYTPGGRRIKNPRACPRLWQAKNGKYLLWYHNHSGKDFNDRNPAWVTGGVEKDGRIYWSQPEILLWDP